MANQNLLADFHRDGFVVLKKFIPDHLLLAFSKEAALVLWDCLKKNNPQNIIHIFEQGWFHSSAIRALEKVDHEHVAAVYDTLFMTPSFNRIAFDLQIESIIHLLTETNSPLYALTTRCRIDQPEEKGRTYNWHQQVFYSIPESSFVQLWAPLIYPTTKENGTLWVAKGSHKHGVAEATWTEIPNGATQIIVKPSLVDKYEQMQVEMELGDLMVFSPMTFHKSGENKSAHVRFSMIGMYHSIASEGFIAPKPSFETRNLSPREHFDNWTEKWRAA